MSSGSPSATGSSRQLLEGRGGKGRFGATVGILSENPPRDPRTSLRPGCSHTHAPRSTTRFCGKRRRRATEPERKGVVDFAGSKGEG